MSAEDNIRVVQAVYDLFNRGDVAGLDELIAADCVLEDVATGQTFHGPDGFRAWLAPWKIAAPDGRADVTSIVAMGDMVATEHVGRGTNTGPLLTPAGEAPPSGNPIELKFSEFFEVRDGKIARARAYMDMATFLRQVGLMP